MFGAKDRSEEVGNGASVLVIPEGAANEGHEEMDAEAAIAMASIEQIVKT